MFVRKVSLRNVRGFEALDFDFTRPDGTGHGWTVITGDNGSGKSTLLKAIAVCLTGKDTARALQPNFHGWIRHGAEPREASIELELSRTLADDALSGGGRNPEEAGFPAKVVLKNGGRETTIASRTPDSKLKKAEYRTPERTIWSPDASGWFSCGYGPFRRVFGASPEAMQQMVTPSTSRFATMFQEAASLAEADRWLRDLKYKALEGREAERQQLEILTELLQDELMPNQIKVARIDSDGLWLKDRNGVELAWSEMSDGYRAALALLTDLVRHLIATYGPEGLVERDENGRLYIARSGVVLIDEIDAHLHPEWQREIGFWLKRHFPKIQFIVTTHSPLICQAADRNGLFVLPEPGSDSPPRDVGNEEYDRIIRSRPDTILLTSAFGLEHTRSPRAVEARNRGSRLKAKQRGGSTLTASESAELQQDLPFLRDDEL